MINDEHKSRTSTGAIDITCTDRRCPWYDYGCRQTNQDLCPKNRKFRVPRIDIDGMFPVVDGEDW